MILCCCLELLLDSKLIVNVPFSDLSMFSDSSQSCILSPMVYTLNTNSCNNKHERQYSLMTLLCSLSLCSGYLWHSPGWIYSLVQNFLEPSIGRTFHNCHPWGGGENCQHILSTWASSLTGDFAGTPTLGLSWRRLHSSSSQIFHQPSSRPRTDSVLSLSFICCYNSLPAKDESSLNSVDYTCSRVTGIVQSHLQTFVNRQFMYTGMFCPEGFINIHQTADSVYLRAGPTDRGCCPSLFPPSDFWNRFKIPACQDAQEDEMHPSLHCCHRNNLRQALPSVKK